MRLTQKRTETEGGFAYYELTFDFGPNRVAKRYVSEEMWRARFSDARSPWVIWHAVKGDEFAKPPLQGRLL